jgi:hypothetical protein
MNIDIIQLNKSIYFLNIKELKDICTQLLIPINGDKQEIINDIITRITTGKIPSKKNIPDCSKGKRKNIILTEQTVILKGEYKNDLKTRSFFKQLIGDHFHFTADGIDWLNKQWLNSNSPTYKKFAEFWIQNHNNPLRKKPKETWAYICFMQKSRDKGYSKKKSLSQWHTEREKHVKIIKNIIKSILK